MNRQLPFTAQPAMPLLNLSGWIMLAMLLCALPAAAAAATAAGSLDIPASDRARLIIPDATAGICFDRWAEDYDESSTADLLTASQPPFKPRQTLLPAIRPVSALRSASDRRYFQQQIRAPPLNNS